MCVCVSIYDYSMNNSDNSHFWPRIAQTQLYTAFEKNFITFNLNIANLQTDRISTTAGLKVTYISLSKEHNPPIHSHLMQFYFNFDPFVGTNHLKH